jgi:hypothetical protein
MVKSARIIEHNRLQTINLKKKNDITVSYIIFEAQIPSF